MANTVKITKTTWRKIDDMLRGGGINVGFSLGGGQPQLSYAAARNDGVLDVAQFEVVSITGILVTSEYAAFYEGKYGFSVTDINVFLGAQESARRTRHIGQRQRTWSLFTAPYRTEQTWWKISIAPYHVWRQEA